MKYTKFFFFLLIINLLISSCACLLKKPYCIKNYAVIETTQGNFVIGLYEGTPLHRDNFINSCKNNIYDSVLVYKVLPSSTISIGLKEDKSEKEELKARFPEETIKAEFNPELIHKKHAVAMHRKDDYHNPEKKSDSKLFYVVEGAVLTDRMIEGIINHKNQQIYNKYLEKFLSKEENEIWKDSLTNLAESGNNAEWSQLRASLYQKAREMALEDNVDLFDVNSDSRQIYSTIGGIPVYDNVNTVFGIVTFGFPTIKTISAKRVDINRKPLKDIFILNTKILNRREYRKYLRNNK